MAEWWTYRLSDFLMFAPRTYYRLFELYNAEVWPLHVAALALGLAVFWLIWRGGHASGRVVCAILALVWLFVAWAYHWQRYATINLGAAYYAAGFAIEGFLLLGFAARRDPRIRRPMRMVDGIPLLLFLTGLAGYPLIAPLAGRPWAQSELFGIAPDPTAMATLAALLLLTGRVAWLLMLLPLLWCAISALTLWTIGSPEALLPAASALVAVLAAAIAPRRRPSICG